VGQLSRIYLIGLPGSGKSTVGSRLAGRLNLPFTDSDHVIEQRIGCSIRDFFEREGETAFRDIEQSVIEELVHQQESSVLATGGGAVVRRLNRERLHQAGYVVYLHATPEQIIKRLRHDTRRPLLQVENPLAQLRSLYTDRDSLYREASHFVVETNGLSVAALVDMLLKQLKRAQAAPPHP
jgi:shikimate kinase